MISCIKCMTHGVLAVCKSVSCSTDGTVEHNSSHSTQHRLSETTYNRQIEVQGCWCSANATVSGTIPTYGSDIGRIPTDPTALLWHGDPQVLLKQPFVYKRDWKNTKACAWLSATLRSGEKQIENVKEETEKKKTARIQMRMCAGNV